ncbi:uncharacterized protein LOC127144160 [Cucumis melo]|uniref:Uncharacterized protein LOC127144160 n=1 Tax=Cucumis melo TaxID=3656 RepID=A0ABM3KD27_CUCME|nr:uncharacterized protein LOC127144160 [Cucumis melo]
MSKVDSNFTLKVQDMFSTKSLFKQCVQATALRDNFQYVTVKSNKEVIILQCAIENCKWSMHASCCIRGDRSLWVLTKFGSKHTCSVDVPLTDRRHATFTVIKDLIKNKIYLAAWHAREAALDGICGSSEDSYKMLPRFAYILELNNPGSVVEYKVDSNVISIDETSLKNKYSGTLLSASTFNANDHIFPLAFCVVDSENNSFSTWFCNQLKRIIGGRNEVVIVSNRHKSICKAIEVVFPNVLHCMCLVHLLKNLKLKYKRIVDTVFHACGKTFNIVDFEHEIRLLESSVPSIREELKSIDFAKWSRAYSPRRRYNVMTTNISESLNSTMLKARELLICLMFKILRMMLQRWFFERRNEADNYQVTDFIITIEGILREQI